MKSASPMSAALGAQPRLGLFTAALLLCLAGCAGDPDKPSPAASAPGQQAESRIGVINVMDSYLTMALFGFTPLNNQAATADLPFEPGDRLIDRLDNAPGRLFKRLTAPIWAEDSDADLQQIAADSEGERQALRPAYLESLRELCVQQNVTRILIMRSPDSAYGIMQEERLLAGYGIARFETPVGTRSLAYATFEFFDVPCRDTAPVRELKIKQHSPLLDIPAPPENDADPAELELAGEFLDKLVQTAAERLQSEFDL